MVRDNIKKDEDLKKVQQRENRYSTLAKVEGKGAEKRAKAEEKAGLTEAAKDSRWEMKQDRYFAKKRKRIATAAMIKRKKVG